MAARVSNQTGPWSTGSTWVGGVAPGNGDTATIANTHVVTVTSSQIVGHSPAASDVTAAVLINSGGQLVINSGVVFTCRGDFQCSGSNSTRSLIMNAGAEFEFDASLAGTPSTARYRFIQPSQYAGSQPSLLISGSSGSRCKFRSVNTSSAANGRFVGSGGSYEVLQDVQYCDFLRIGDASNDGWIPLLNSDGSDAAASIFRHVFCTYDACGRMNIASGQIAAYAKFTYENNHWSNSVGTLCLSISAFTDKAGAASVRSVKQNIFDIQVNLGAPRHCTIDGNFFNAGYTTSDPGGTGWTISQNNFVRMTSPSNSDIITAGDVVDEFWFYDAAAQVNPHFMQSGTYAAATPYDVDGCIFEFAGTDGQGDCVLAYGAPPSPVVINIFNCIFLPNSGDNCSGTGFSCLGSANITINYYKNTLFTGQEGCAVGETYTGHAGMVARFDSSIFWDSAGGRGAKIYDDGVDDAVNDIVTSANANYNCGYQLLTNQAKSYGRTASDIEFSSGSPGANDVEANPQFVAPTRDLASWDASLGGAGTAANAIAELKKLNLSTYNSSYNIASLLAYIRGGFAPRNRNLRGAGLAGVDIGAVAVTSGRKNPTIRCPGLFG